MCICTSLNPADGSATRSRRAPARWWHRQLFVLLLSLCHGLPALAAFPAEPPRAPQPSPQLRLASSYTPGTGAPTGQAGAWHGDDAELAAWRRKHKVLRVAVVGNYLPPFDLVDLKGDYRGISADYLAVLVARLGIPAKIFRYPSHELARSQLVNGAVDLITTSLDDPGAGLRTAPYHDLRLIEVVSRRDKARNQANRTIGYLAGEVSPAALHRAYPGAPLQPFENLLGALNQLSRDADFVVVVTNATAAGYLVEQYRYDELTARNFVAPMAQAGVTFAVADPSLGRIVDRTLAAMPASLKREIETAWIASSLEFDITDKLNLSGAERAWIAGHPEVRYLVSRDFVPFQFAEARGASADSPNRCCN
ncbi:hypothetical protein UB46_02705 [Burkholderiaceae bacterium 16]|nr:hypothetical protein UB46_02705 [Burkholderiaceae bacterium 16]